MWDLITCVVEPDSAAEASEVAAEVYEDITWRV